MQYGEFVNRVAERAGFGSTEEADRAATATLSVLGERLKGGEPKDAGAQLPPELADAIGFRGPGEIFDLTEFYRRVAEREGGGTLIVDAQWHAGAVMEVLLDAVSPGERDDILSQLPQEYALLLPT
jgi:uncharacterized protein (DUF2267 family)